MGQGVNLGEFTQFMKTESSATPRTEDKILVGTNTLNQGEYVEAAFARALETELEVWQECARHLREFAIAYTSHPKRNPDDKLAVWLAQYDRLNAPPK